MLPTAHNTTKYTRTSPPPPAALPDTRTDTLPRPALCPIPGWSGPSPAGPGHHPARARASGRELGGEKGETRGFSILVRPRRGGSVGGSSGYSGWAFFGVFRGIFRGGSGRLWWQRERGGWCRRGSGRGAVRGCGGGWCGEDGGAGRGVSAVASGAGGGGGGVIFEGEGERWMEGSKG
ncbi:hypothetical protein M758_3G098100 [Ceratodon purpureus]|nr:hypothetical protein M758_3G098100 [Ceratodon purpureus]